MKLNLLRIFTREESVAGLEVTESALRLSLLEEDKKTGAAKPAFSVFEPLPEGTILGGAISDSPKFLTALQNIVKKAPSRVRYAILSIPGDAVYSKTFTFPKTVQGQKLDEAMKLAIGYQLPLKESEAYLGWEKAGAKDDNTEVLLSAIPKTIINAYIDAMGAAGLNAVAIEFHPLSFARVMECPPKASVLVKIQGSSSGAIYIVKNGLLVFSRVIPFGFAEKDKFGDEARKVKDFYEAEHGPIMQEIFLNDAAPNKENTFVPGAEKERGSWLTSFGAARRGLLPRSEDQLISLMPVSTEQAYEYHKAIIFSEFISNLTIGIAAFFAAAFLLTWAVMLSLQARSLKELETASSLPVPSDASALEDTAKNMNALASVGAQALANISPWSPAFEGIKNLVPAGIVVKNFSMNDLAATITMDGTANNRTALNAFKRTLSSSTLITSISFPASDLNQTANIPFSVSFKLTQG